MNFNLNYTYRNRSVADLGFQEGGRVVLRRGANGVLDPNPSTIMK